MRSPMQLKEGAWQLQLSFPASLAPLTLAYTVYLSADAEQERGYEGMELKPRRGGCFSVPVGMCPGEAVPLGEIF